MPGAAEDDAKLDGVPPEDLHQRHKISPTITGNVPPGADVLGSLRPAGLHMVDSSEADQPFGLI